jgi:hypothetical protein
MFPGSGGVSSMGLGGYKYLSGVPVDAFPDVGISPVKVSGIDHVHSALKGCADKFSSVGRSHLGLKSTQGKGPEDQGGNLKTSISKLYSIQGDLLSKGSWKRQIRGSHLRSVPSNAAEADIQDSKIKNGSSGS